MKESYPMPTPPPNQNPDQNIVVENMFSPEVFASLASSFSINAGIVTIKFVSLRWDNSVDPAVQKAVVVARITMPLQGAQTLAGGLDTFLQQHGLGYDKASRTKARAAEILANTPTDFPM